MASKYDIEVISGDVLEYYFILKNMETDAVKEVMFTCRGQNFCVHLPYWELQGGYCLRFTSEMTEKLKIGTFGYDLTVELNDGNLLTLIYQGVFRVKPKPNKLCDE